MGTRTHTAEPPVRASDGVRAPFTLPRFALPPVPSLSAPPATVVTPTTTPPPATPPAVAPAPAPAPAAPAQVAPAPAQHPVPHPTADPLVHHPSRHVHAPGVVQLARDLRSNAMLGLTVAIVLGVVLLAGAMALLKLLHGEPPGMH